MGEYHGLGDEVRGAHREDAGAGGRLRGEADLTTLRAIALAGALIGLARVAAASDAQAGTEDAPAWRSARWGMSVEEVLKAFPREAARLESPLVLADGNVVAAGIDGYLLGAERFQVRFVFAAGRLCLVSLRTPERTYAPADRYAAVAERLSAELGRPGEETKDDSLIDLRQRRWDVGATRVDLKYIPGVVVVLYSPLPRAAEGAPAARAPGGPGQPPATRP